MVSHEILIIISGLVIIYWILYSYLIHLFIQRRLKYQLILKKLFYKKYKTYFTLKKEYIYFIYRPNFKIKIGKSTNLRKRLKTHRTTLGKVWLLGVIPVHDCQKAENYILKKFNKSNWTLEVYYIHLDLLLFILMNRHKRLTNSYQKMLDNIVET